MALINSNMRVMVLDEVRTLCRALVTPTPSSSSPKAVDGYVALVFTMALFMANWALRMLVVAPVARVLLQTPKSKRRSLEAQVVKFSQAAMECVFYGGFTALGACIVPAQPWIWPSKLWWIDFQSGSHSLMRDDLRCYYLLYGARYLQNTVSVLLEPKRKDFLEMQIHHVVTFTVIAISYLYGWNRIGAVVMLLLDPADVPLHIAKMLKYVADARRATQPRLAAVCAFGADRTFELFALFFFVTRICFYPYVCWSAHIEATRYFPKGPPEWACVVLLETLYVLQCYWFALIIKVAVKMILTGHAEDVRSDDELDDDDPPSKTD